ncbi:hemolysin XhlA family protein [Acetoanaerobium noterae]|uniref:hemolysin XhlA family protein n=1 Tax=Acetoanaerobium noterae TaxID=745369 RepID=UPI00331C596D
MENKLCELTHKRIDEKLDLQERRINDHSKRIDLMEQNNTRMDEKLAGLILQLGNLNTTLKWFIGLMVGGFVSFFFYAVQKGVI